MNDQVKPNIRRQMMAYGSRLARKHRRTFVVRVFSSPENDGGSFGLVKLKRTNGSYSAPRSEWKRMDRWLRKVQMVKCKH
jgi:hypothetical protein